MIFKNRIEAGKLLATLLENMVSKNPMILGLTRGGVPVANEVARALHRPMDVLIVRKLGVPWHPELAFGAIGEEDELYINHQIVDQLEISKEAINGAISREKEEIRERQLKFRNGRSISDLSGKCVIIVDDGIATGATAEVACRIAKKMGALEVILAAPVGAKESIERLSKVADKCSIFYIPENLSAVGEWYLDFSPTTDEEVAKLMKETKVVSED